jgi:hypothetical protein
MERAKMTGISGKIVFNQLVALSGAGRASAGIYRAVQDK